MEKTIKTSDQASSASTFVARHPFPTNAPTPTGDWAYQQATAMLKGLYTLKGSQARQLADDIARALRKAAINGEPR
jgi:hypothetical protein